jgi:AcrR family transcriptional regulator
MASEAGLRERKKQRTLEAICQTATTLMLERGFDNVSMADIAAAADVSKMTVFNYFPTKEDIILCQIEDHTDEAARVVRSRPVDESPLTALRRHFLDRIAAADPAVGVNGDKRILEFTRLVIETPSLMLRFTDQQLRAQHSLTAALAEVSGTDELTAVVAASQIVNVQRTLTTRNLTCILQGADQVKLRVTAAAEAERAFQLLERGLGQLALVRGSCRPRCSSRLPTRLRSGLDPG